MKAVCNEVSNSHDLNSVSSGIGTLDLVIWSGALTTHMGENRS